MGQNRVVSEKAEPFECGCVANPVALEYVAMFPITFRTVRLCQHTFLFGEPAETFEQLVGAGGDEPWGHNWLNQTVVVCKRANIGDRPTRSIDPIHGAEISVPIGCPTWMIHCNPAYVRPLSVGETGLRQGCSCWLVYGGEVHGRGGSLAQ